MTQMQPPEGNCRWQISVQLTKKELQQCWACGDRYGKRIIYTVLLSVLLLNNVFVLCTAPIDGTVVVVSILLVCAIAVLWLQPWWQQRRAVQEAAGSVLWVSTYDGGMYIGQQTPVWVDWEECRPCLVGDLMVLQIDDQRIGIPRRVLSEEEWQWLLSVCTTKEDRNECE